MTNPANAAGSPASQPSGASGCPRAAALAEAIRQSKPLTARYLAGFNDVTAVRQTPDLPNHVAWTLGHCALTMHRVAGMIDGGPIPASDFVLPPAADGYSGSREKGLFDSEAVAFGSRPEERHDRYPTLERARKVFDAALDRLAAAVESCNDEKLNASVRWGAADTPLHALIIRMIFHNGFHTGQIADLRRALGFKSVFA